jgi:hypothetical protein
MTKRQMRMIEESKRIQAEIANIKPIVIKAELAQLTGNEKGKVAVLR